MDGGAEARQAGGDTPAAPARMLSRSRLIPPLLAHTPWLMTLPGSHVTNRKQRRMTRTTWVGRAWISSSLRPGQRLIIRISARWSAATLRIGTAAPWPLSQLPLSRPERQASGAVAAAGARTGRHLAPAAVARARAGAAPRAASMSPVMVRLPVTRHCPAVMTS